MYNTLFYFDTDLSELLNEMYDNLNTAAVRNKASRRVLYHATAENGVATVTADLPGIAKEDISITIEDNGLKVVAKNDKRNYFFNLPQHKDWDFTTTSAKLDSGVLTLTIQQKQQAQKTTIPIQ